MLKTSVCYSAPVKVILFGEHFVVRGAPAIAAAIGLRCYACCYPSDGVYVEAPDVSVQGDLRCVRSALPGLARIIEALGAEGVSVKVWCEAPIGAGLGSSAAVSTALAAALVVYTRGELDNELVWQLAFEAEKVHHGKPSGVDNTVALYGGVVLFHSRGLWEKLQPPRDAKLVLADTGVSRSTRKAVETVLANWRYALRPTLRIYEAAAALVNEAVHAIRKGDLELIGKLMDMNHGLLYSMGVSTYEIERLVWAARRAGAYGAKLTGAGLGGFIIALVDDDRAERVRRALLDAGARKTWVVELGSEGLRREDASRR